MGDAAESGVSNPADVGSPKRFAFVRLGPVPVAQRPLLEQLKNRFPELEPDVIDVKEWLARRRDVFTIGALVAGLTYAPGLLSGQRRPNDAFFRTPFMFHAIRRLVASRISPATHRFSVQMQSLFDASVDGVPNFVYTDHTNKANLQYPTTPPGTIYPDHWQELEQKIYARAARVLTRSENIRRSVIEQYGATGDRVVTVYVGSNTRITEYDTTLERYRRGHVLFVGLDWARKGGPELLHAWRRVQPEFPNARLTIIGVSPTVRDASVEVLGRVPLDRLPEQYANASIFCMPARLEPFGVVYVEAMSHALPIVATRIGALPDMVEEGRNGFLVEPGDVNGLAESLATLMRDPERSRAFGRRSKEIADARYAWESVGRRIEREIRDVLGG